MNTIYSNNFVTYLEFKNSFSEISLLEGFTTVSNAPNVFRMTETLRRSLKSKYRYGNPEDHTWSLLTKSYYLQLVTLLNYSRAIVSVLKCIRDNEKMDNLTTVQAIGSSVLIGKVVRFYACFL